MDEKYQRWGDDVVEALIEHHNRGLRYKEIAQELSQKFEGSYTVGAVAGKISAIYGPKKRKKGASRPVSVPWTQQQSDDAIRLWRDGNSASQIARMLSAKYGRDWTRNAVIGRIHRAKAADDRVAQGSPRVRKITRRKGSLKKTPLFTGTKKHVEPPQNWIPTNREHSDYVAALVGTKYIVHEDPARELGQHDCRMPSGSFARDRSFCGKPTMPGSSYCQPCHQVVFRKTVEDQNNSRKFSGKPLLKSPRSTLIKA